MSIDFAVKNKEAILEHFKAHRDVINYVDSEDGGVKAVTVKGKATKHAFRILGNYQDAEDAAQEAYTRLLGNVDRYAFYEFLDPLFFTVLTNECYNIRRKRGGYTFEDSDDNEQVENLPDISSDPLRNLVSEEELDRVFAQLAKLSNARAAVIKMALVYGMPYAEVSEASGVHISSIDRYIREFRESLGDIKNEQGVFYQ